MFNFLFDLFVIFSLKQNIFVKVVESINLNHNTEKSHLYEGNAFNVVLSDPNKCIKSLHLQTALVESKPLNSAINKMTVEIKSENLNEFTQTTIKKDQTSEELICGRQIIGIFAPETMDNDYKSIQGWIFTCKTSTILYLIIHYFISDGPVPYTYEVTYKRNCHESPIVVLAGSRLTTWYINKYKKEYEIDHKLEEYLIFNIHWQSMKKRHKSNCEIFKLVSAEPFIERQLETIMATPSPLSATSLGISEPYNYCKKLSAYFSINLPEHFDGKNCKSVYHQTIHQYLSKPEYLLILPTSIKIVRKKSYRNLWIILLSTMAMLIFIFGTALYARYLKYKPYSLQIDILKTTTYVENMRGSD
ncbi:hypothetical protein SNEBB_002626 [Seison nebaliae]|nr:hypothetical protein SNEBB_002626 [Seison nebaliae]